MRVTRHQHHKQILFDYSLYHQTLENVQLAKCLGITVTDNIDWGQHVSDVSSKATKTLGFLRRNLAFTPRSTKEVAYKTLVLPKLEYAAPIWSPHSKLQVNQIEKVQRKTACWTGDGERRVVSAKCLMSLNGHLLRPGGTSPLCFSFTRFIVEQCLLKQTSIWPPAHSLKTTRSSHSAQYRRHQTYSDALMNSFFPRVIPHWNSQSPSVANIQSTKELRVDHILTKIQPKVFMFLLLLFFFCLFF